ncbi:hypothetical protein [Hymenobacter algoricola]|uniref:DUF4890 domain-containing protein n=1 Tax=Hymenobacter algoricola TaxID=486267 RepID=A0ABP7MUL7_9BACT
MKTLLLATAALLTTAATQAQTAPAKTKTKTETSTATVKTKTKAPAAAPKPVPAPPAEKVDAKAAALTANMRQALNLTPAQAEKVQQINVTSVRNVETARLQYRTDLRKLNAIINDIGQSRLAGLKDVLTPDQFARYQRKREEKMGIQTGAANQGNPVPGMPGGNE